MQTATVAAPAADAAQLPANAHASPRALARATGAAALAAAAILVLFVLPAEAGVDPTGVGSAIGLTAIAQGAEAPSGQPAAGSAASAAIPSRATIERKGAWRQDEMRIELAPHSGREVKAHMEAGDTLLFQWQSRGGPVKVDMHGERPDAADGEFTSYWQDRALESAQGAFTAPFAGIHGWYWRNKGDTPVTVTVRTSGFYRDLFQPGEE